jgi:excisionase family DNA binding protein
VSRNNSSNEGEAAALRAADPLTVRIPEAVRLTGISKTRFYELIKAGEITTIKLGATTLISFAVLKAYIAKIENRGDR